MVIKFLDRIDTSNEKWLGVLDDQRDANKTLFETLCEKIEKIACGATDTNDKVDRLDTRIQVIESKIEKNNKVTL